MLTTTEGLEVLSHLDLHDMALRMCDLKDALPKEVDVFDMVVEQPSLLLLQRSLRVEVTRRKLKVIRLTPC